MDISVTVPRLPGPGSTVLGSAARFTPGGKGANQAVAAARLGASVAMVGCVGRDDFGQQLLKALTDEGIDTAAVAVLDGAPTGLAMITVDAGGENIITVAPGANREVSHAQVGAADVLVISAEIPLDVVRQALRQQHVVVLNLAPAPPAADAVAIVAAGVDWLVVNETEAAAVLGTPVHGLDGARAAATALVAAGARNAVVTAGAALSHLDLALALIRRASPELANVTARYLVVDERTSQSIYSIPDHLAKADPLIRQFERWARGHLAEGFSLDQAAKALATSKRTLARRMQSVLGKSPLAFFQDLRIERAVHLLRTSQASVDQIGAEVGYAEGVTLRTLLRRKLGRSVRDIRRSQ